MRSAILTPLIILFLVLFVSSCVKKEEKTDLNQKVEAEMQKDSAQKGPGSALIKLENKVFSIPSPIQLSYLVKNLNIPYNDEYLNPVSNRVNYQTSFRKSVNLGIYGANLGYVNIYEQYAKAAKYVAVVRNLSNQLGITNSFDKETIDRIEKNSTNKDSLVHILSRVYRDADAYLMNNERKDIAIFVLAGGWIESLYFIAQTATDKPHPDLMQRIAEQKYPLQNLLDLLRPYYQEYGEDVDNMFMALTELSSIFYNIEINYEFKEPEVVPSRKLTIVKSETEVKISDAQIKEIANKIKEIRKKLIE